MRLFTGLNAILVAIALAACGPGTADLGSFDATLDIGSGLLSGSAYFDPGAGQYVLTGSGSNIWDRKDEFRFLYRKLAGDFTLEADLEFLTEGGDPHKKAGWMVRESLEPDAAYADAVIHGDGLIALQYRLAKGGATAEIQAPFKAPASIRFHRDGDLFTLWAARPDREYQPVGSVLVELPGEAQVGLVLCAHDGSRVEKAAFSNVAISSRPYVDGVERVLESSLEVLEVGTGERELIYRARDHFEAPNWSPDGSFLLFNMRGRIYRLDLDDPEPKMIDTDFADRCNNDHGFSPDGSWLAISHSPPGGSSLIYVLPAAGGIPRLVTQKGPSYWHGWSPDGKTLAYCASRDGEYDVYTIPVSGGSERRITRAEGLDDGPDYSPDGQWIYFNSERTGLMKIWRTSPDGKGQEQVTKDLDYADWFPHPSPDGKWIVFLSYDKEVKGHPPNQEVALRIMPVEGGEARILARLFGGQGTINVPSWSPDSRRFAFVSYRQVIP